MSKPRLLIFASGTKTNGGSGFENLVQATKTGELDAEIVGVVSNHERGGVREHADRLRIPFIHFDPTGYLLIQANKQIAGDEARVAEEAYRKIVQQSGAEWVMHSGWLKFVHGLDPQKTFNIHPALLSFDHGRFGGPGMYGMHIHEAVKHAFDAGEITETGCSMHFITEEYDRGPIFFECRIPLRKGMSAKEIQKAVQEVEHEWQPKITNMVVHGKIKWDGRNPASLVVPEGYAYLPK